MDPSPIFSPAQAIIHASDIPSLSLYDHHPIERLAEVPEEKQQDLSPDTNNADNEPVQEVNSNSVLENSLINSHGKLSRVEKLTIVSDLFKNIYISVIPVKGPSCLSPPLIDAELNEEKSSGTSRLNNLVSWASNIIPVYK